MRREARHYVLFEGTKTSNTPHMSPFSTAHVAPPAMSKESVNEKRDGVMVEKKAVADTSRADLDGLPDIGTPERILAERKLVRKLDCRLLPTIFLIYIMNYIDVSRVLLISAPQKVIECLEERNHYRSVEGFGAGSGALRY
jgi:hypothetical protein